MRKAEQTVERQPNPATHPLTCTTVQCVSLADPAGGRCSTLSQLLLLLLLLPDAEAEAEAGAASVHCAWREKAMGT